jgi:hypothetical protein
MPERLSLLCVTRGEKHTPRFFGHFSLLANLLRAELVIGCDRCDVDVPDAKKVHLDASSCPVVETILEEAVSHCSGEYVLRLDDDETVSLAMAGYLMAGDWQKHEAIGFPRAHLWVNESIMLTDAHWWPDVQMRLSLKKHAVRKFVHEGAPRLDVVVGGALLHHLWLVRTREERLETCRRYHAAANQAMPENPTVWPTDHGHELAVAYVNDGRVRHA